MATKLIIKTVIIEIAILVVIILELGEAIETHEDCCETLELITPACVDEIVNAVCVNDDFKSEFLLP